TSTINAFRIDFPSGNIASGTIRCYGIAKTTGSGSNTNYFTQNGNVLYNNTGYQLCINSSTPVANFSVVGTSSAPTIPLVSIASSSGSSYFTVLANGSVGIGTTGPTSTLF